MAGKYNYLNRVLNPDYGPFETSSLKISGDQVVINSLEFVDEDDDEPDEPLTANHPAIVQLVDLLVREALQWNTTVIRIEPHEQWGRVHYQIDGRFIERDSMPWRVCDAIIERIKLCQEGGKDLVTSLSVRITPQFFASELGEIVWLTIERQ